MGDEGVGGPGGHDGGDDLLVVALLVLLRVGVKELVDDVGEVGGDLLPHLGAGVLGGDHLAHLDQAVDGDAAPVAVLLFVQLAPEPVEGVGGRVDEHGQFLPLVFRDGAGEEGLNLVPDDTGGAGEEVAEGVVLPMEVAEEVLCALGQLADGVQVDDLRRGGQGGGVAAGEEL